MIGRQHSRARQPVKQGGLAGVGVTHQRDHGQIVFFALAAALPALLSHFLQTLVDHLDALTDQAPVGFQLGLTRPAQADAALLPFQVGPAPDQAG